MSRNLNQETPRPDTNTARQSATTPRELLEIPYDIMLEFFSTMATSSESSADLISLANTSRQTYVVFKQNERVLFNRAIRGFAKQSLNDTHFNCLVNMAILRTAKPWPVDPTDIEAALLALPYSNPDLTAIPREHFGSILAYVRSKSPYPPPVDKGFRRIEEESEFRTKRIQYTADNGLEALGGGWRLYVEHPFDSFNPSWTCIWNRGVLDEKAYLEEVIWATIWYAEHAATRVSDHERSLFGTEGYVSCCLLEKCPRFSNEGTSLQGPRLRGR